MATITVRNGVDVDRLVQTIGAIGQDSNIGRFTFKARTDWSDGGTSTANMTFSMKMNSTPCARLARSAA